MRGQPLPDRPAGEPPAVGARFAAGGPCRMDDRTDREPDPSARTETDDAEPGVPSASGDHRGADGPKPRNRGTRPPLGLDSTNAGDEAAPDGTGHSDARDAADADAKEGLWTDRSATAGEHEPDAGRSASLPKGRGADDHSGRSPSGRASGYADDGRTSDDGDLGMGGSLFDRLRRALGSGRRAGFADAYDADAHGPLATFEASEGIEERERYWVRHPYTMVVITTEPATLGDGGIGGRAVGLTDAQKRAYVTLLFHTAAIQGAASGFVAGQMAKGDLADGAKHAAIMLTLAYGSFLLFA